MFLTCDKLTRTHTLVSISLASEISEHGKVSETSKSETRSGAYQNLIQKWTQTNFWRSHPPKSVYIALFCCMSFTGYYTSNFIQDLGQENGMILIGQVIGWNRVNLIWWFWSQYTFLVVEEMLFSPSNPFYNLILKTVYYWWFEKMMKIPVNFIFGNIWQIPGIIFRGNRFQEEGMK